MAHKKAKMDEAVTGVTSVNNDHSHTFTMTKGGEGQTDPGGVDQHVHRINEGKALWWGEHMHSIIGPDRKGA